MNVRSCSGCSHNTAQYRPLKNFFRTYQNFSKHTNFPDIAKFPTKLTQFLIKFTEFVPFFFTILVLLKKIL